MVSLHNFNTMWRDFCVAKGGQKWRRYAHWEE